MYIKNLTRNAKNRCQKSIKNGDILRLLQNKRGLKRMYV